MPLLPTPPKAMWWVARWMMVSLMHPPPKEQVFRTLALVFLLRVKR